MKTRPMEAAGAVDAKSTRPPLLGKQNSFPPLPQAITGDISISLRTGTFLFRFDIL